MARDPLFDTAWLKWGRAVVHMQSLEAGIDSFGPDSDQKPTIAVRAEYHPSRHGFGIYITDISATPANWGLLLGDVANNLRSCLDQIAWALVTRGRTPPDTLGKKAKGIYFPIAKDRAEFRQKAKTNLPGVRRADITTVRRYQPYQRGLRRGRWSAWLLLVELNTADKHRTVQPIWAFPMASEVEVVDQQDCVLSQNENLATRKPMNVGAELAFVRVRKTGPEPRLKVKLHIVAEPSFVGLVRLRDWLREARQWTGAFLAEFSEPPPEIHTIGIDWNGPA